MASDDRTQEQILARLAAMETYLAQIASAVSTIAKKLNGDDDVHSRLSPAPPVIPDPLGEKRSWPMWRPERDEITEIFGRREPLASPGIAQSGKLDATQILSAASQHMAPPEAPKQEEGEFTKEFLRRDETEAAPAPQKPEPDEFDKMFGPRETRGGTT